MAQAPTSGFRSSLQNLVWQVRSYDERLVQALQQQLRVSLITARLLAGKQLTPETAKSYLQPTLRELLPDPFHLLDMDKAVAVAVAAITQHKKIVIFGDYDVDGATSSALLKLFLARLGVMAEIYIPDRILEGYGPNIAAIEKLRQDGFEVMITVDCGIVAFAALNAAKQVGLEVVVLDHHMGMETLPDVAAVVNPNRLDETSAYGNLAGVGVSFLFCVALHMQLKSQRYYQQANIPEPDLLNFLDLVALGTVCDVVPLINVNRAFVRQGLKIMAQRKNLGLRLLADMAKVDSAPTTYHLGYVLGPRLNAGGRVGDANLSAELLSTHDISTAEDIARKLEYYNQLRKEIEKDIVELCIQRLEQLQEIPNFIVMTGDNWHAGVIGIVASRLKEKYNRPTAVISFNDEGIGKASCRSVMGVDVGAMIMNAKVQGLLLEGGGHKMAGGFSLQREQLPALQTYLQEAMADKMTGLLGEQVLELDAVVQLGGIDLALAHEIDNLGPYGAANSQPLIAVRDIIIKDVKTMGADHSHLRCLVSDNLGHSLNATIFSAMNNAMGPALINAKGKTADMVGRVGINNYLGRDTVQFLVEDVAL